VPVDRSLATTIENYPYPYVVGKLCWEFPCMTPSDWQADHLHHANNPRTVRDWETALDATVIKQGTFTFVFHPWGWIRSRQLVEFIDYAHAKYGKKVKFLTFREALGRLNKNLLGGQPLRAADGGDNGVRLLDVDNDGYLDVVIGNGKVKQTRRWSPGTLSWQVTGFPVPVVTGNGQGPATSTGVRFGILGSDGKASFFVANEHFEGCYHFDGRQWARDAAMLDGLPATVGSTFSNPDRVMTSLGGHDRGARLRDVDGSGRCQLIVSNNDHNLILRWSPDKKTWEPLPFALPDGVRLVDGQGRDQGVRFVDIDEDGYPDVLFSNEKAYGLYLFTPGKGWTRKVTAGKQGEPGALPMIARRGTNNGAWFHNRTLWVQNENTALLKDLVDRRSFNDMIMNVEPTARSPQASLHSIHTRPGFQVELMVSEPLVQSPINIAWGPDGKLWVVEMGDYPLGADNHGKAGSRVKYLESTKGDGRYDKATLFLDGLHYATGVMPWGKGVLITCAPDILYAEATKGSGKADVVKKLYSGFVQGNPQHRCNGLTYGLDNWIYGANGDSGGNVRSAKTGKLVGISGRDFRLRPEDGAFETATGGSQYGRCRDDWGNWFGCNNSAPMYQFVLDDHYLRRNPYLRSPDPRVQVSVAPGAAPVYPISRTLPRFNDPEAANHFTSACSVIVYRDDLFGPLFAGNSFVSEPVHDLVHREIVSPRGVTFTSHRAADEQTSEFWASSDNWTRPTTIRVGPDGALWVVDMYREVIEHPEWIPPDWQKRLDLLAGHDRGRIYRVYPVGKKPRAIPRLDRLDTDGLVAALDSPSGWQRDLSQQILVQKQDRDAVEGLQWMAGRSRNPLARLHALCTLDGLHALDAKLLGRALHDPHPGVRRHAVRLCESLLAAHPDLGVEMAGLAKDADPHVRMQLAYSLGEWDDARAGEALGRLAVRDHDDPYLWTAILSSVNKKNLEAVLLAVLSNSPGAPPARMIEDLLQMASAFGNPRALTTILQAVASPKDGRYADWQIAALAGLLDTLDQRKTPLGSLRENADAELQAVFKKLPALFAHARAVVQDRHATLTERALAVRLVGRGLGHQDEDLKLLADLLTPQTPGELQAAAVTTLGRIPNRRVPPMLLEEWKGFGPALRSQALDVLLQRDEWAGALLDAIAKKQVLAMEIDPARRQRLLQYPQGAVRDRAAKLFAGAVNPDRQKVLEAYQSVLTMKGEPKRGVEVFTKNCSTCHQLHGIGHVVGPDLAAVGDKSPQGLLISILDPNRTVEPRYVNYLATTKSGLTFTGVLANETGSSITLMGQDGKAQVILRADLDELVSTGKSLMPEGLEKEVKPADMADLIAFLRAGLPAEKRRVFDGNQPEVVRPAADGALRLLPANAAVYGEQIVLEKTYGNLGFWRSENDHADWTVEVARPGRYAVWLEWACDNHTAGNRFTLRAGVHELTGKVAGTGTWDDYKREQVGEITLAAGRQEVVFRSAGKVHGYLIDLKGIRLVPVAGK
jgi:putative membrane-bound dehydrogenase-like protein